MSEKQQCGIKQVFRLADTLTNAKFRLRDLMHEKGLRKIFQKVLPTTMSNMGCLDIDFLKRGKKEKKRRLVKGWTGTHSSPYLLVFYFSSGFPPLYVASPHPVFCADSSGYQAC